MSGFCPYCGRAVSNGTYCRNCVEEGFDDLHAVTGRTNGWDRKHYGPSRAKDGWRGQRCIGFGSAKLETRIQFD